MVKGYIYFSNLFKIPIRIKQGKEMCQNKLHKLPGVTLKNFYFPAVKNLIHF